MRAKPTTDHRCAKCGRRLRNTSPDGYGPKCRAKVRKATRAPELGQYKPHLVERAIELIEQGGIVPLRKSSKNRVYLAVSSDGSSAYRTARVACTCPAGLKAVHVCKHRIAAHMFDLTS